MAVKNLLLSEARQKINGDFKRICTRVHWCPLLSVAMYGPPPATSSPTSAMLGLLGSKAAENNNLIHERLVCILYTENTEAVQNLSNFIRTEENVHPRQCKGLTIYLSKRSKRKKETFGDCWGLVDDPAIQRVFPAILLPIPGLCPGAVGRPSMVAIFAVTTARPCARPSSTRAPQPPGRHASPPVRVTSISLLAPPDAAQLDMVIVMIRMHAQDALGPAI